MKDIDATHDGCEGCLFTSSDGCTNKKMKCIPSERDDAIKLIEVLQNHFKL